MANDTASHSSVPQADKKVATIQATIITGAPGSGKTTILDLVARRIDGSVAIVDGDNLGWVFPHKLCLKWLNLVQDNVAACARNFRHYGIDHLLVAYVLPNQERLGRMESLLRSEGFSVGSIALWASEEVLVRRLVKRGQTLERNPELFQVASHCCQEIKRFDQVPHIVTDSLTAEQVAQQLLKMIGSLTRS